MSRTLVTSDKGFIPADFFINIKVRFGNGGLKTLGGIPLSAKSTGLAKAIWLRAMEDEDLTLAQPTEFTVELRSAEADDGDYGDFAS